MAVKYGPPSVTLTPYYDSLTSSFISPPPKPHGSHREIGLFLYMVVVGTEGTFNHDVDHAKEVPFVSGFELPCGQSMFISCPHVLHRILFSCVVVCPFYI